MKEVLEAIERHLGRSLEIAQLDYYQVIGLDLYCDDPAEIKSALQNATNTWMQSSIGQHPQSAQTVGKLIKQAQTILLDPEKRTLYDRQLRKLRASQEKSQASKPVSTGPAIQLPTSASPKPDEDQPFDQGTLPATYPSGDPMAPFAWDTTDWIPDNSGPAAQLLLAVADVETRREEWRQLFPTLNAFDLASSDEEPWSAPSLKQSVAPKSHGQRPGTPVDAASLVNQMRRRRMRNRLLASSAMGAASLALLGFAAFTFLNNRSQLASQDRNAKPQRVPGTGPLGDGPSGNGDSRDVDSTLVGLAPMPKPGEGPAGGDSNSKPRVLSDLPSVRRDEISAASKPSDPVEMESRTESAAADMPPTEGMQPMAVDPTMAVTPAMDETSKPASTDAEALPETPNGSQHAAWSKNMSQARAGLAQQDFDVWEREIASALKAAETSVEKVKASRLDQLGQLYKIYIEAFEEAKRKTRGASTIKVGTAELSIVESNAEKLVVRTQGKNQSFTWDKLPVGIAAALSDLALSDRDPVDVAARAVYFSFSPAYAESIKNNQIMQKRVQEWFDKSLGKGPVRADLQQALTDTYE